mgnify:CR=1 FL=1
MKYKNETLFKQKGIRTNACKINIEKLNSLIEIFENEIDVKNPTKVFDLWVKNNFDTKYTLELLESVIVKFGEGHRIWGRFKGYYETQISDINNVLIDAYEAKDAGINELLEKIQQIKGLGGLSYSTKMARFFNNQYVVLDSILRDELNITENDYDSFFNLCEKIKIDLKNKFEIERNTSQIESAIFTWIQIINPNQRRPRWIKYRAYFEC